jgi:hypothetical protein
MYNIYLNSLNDLMSEEFVYYSSNFTDWNYNKMIKLKDVLMKNATRLISVLLSFGNQYEVYIERRALIPLFVSGTNSKSIF